MKRIILMLPAVLLYRLQLRLQQFLLFQAELLSQLLLQELSLSSVFLTVLPLTRETR